MDRELRQRLSTEYPDWHNIPFLLSKKEMEHPHKVISEFFDCYQLKQVRAFLKEWLYETVHTDEPIHLNFLVLHDHIMKLAEAAWIVHKDKKMKKKKGKK